MGHMADDGAVRDANWEGAIGGRTSFARKGLGSSESTDRVARRCGGRSVIECFYFFASFIVILSNLKLF